MGLNTKRINILLVDDNENDILITRDAFQYFQILNIIDAVNNGKSALEYLRKEGKYVGKLSPTMVLLDIHMPGMSGFEVLDSIKKDPKLFHTPVVMLTTSEYEVDIVKSYAKGACSYVNKPVNPRDFFEVAKQFSLYWELVSVLPGE